MVEAAGIEASDRRMSALHRTTTRPMQKPHNFAQKQTVVRTTARARATEPRRLDTRFRPK